MSTALPRDARESDNAGLLALASACPMAGDIGLCSHRAPDFFALNRLEGERWRVGVVDAPGGPADGSRGGAPGEKCDGEPPAPGEKCGGEPPAPGEKCGGEPPAIGGKCGGCPPAIGGCIAVAERHVYLHGAPATTCYVGDLKVHPRHRGGPVADALSLYALDAAREIGGNDATVLVTILAGNRSMERRREGPRGMPRLRRFATIRAHSVSFLWPRRLPRDVEVEVTRAGPGDLEEMADLWRRVAPARQFAPVLDADALARWIAQAPGLSPSSYFLARRRAGGALEGFVALWDQHSFKQMVVTGYSWRLAIFRTLLNLLAPVVGGTGLPPAGAPMRYLTAVNVCVPGESPGVLRALLLRAYNELRGKGYSFLTIGLDVRDPLSAALDGLMSQPTDIGAYVTTPAAQEPESALDERPLHYEIALV